MRDAGSRLQTCALADAERLNRDTVCQAEVETGNVRVNRQQIFVRSREHVAERVRRGEAQIDGIACLAGRDVGSFDVIEIALL